ncbi:MAG: hypothetical protein HYX72_08425 [Acidobacteria bacterium]|nr:hypothetical protein [Acidobacteriota bacterium]
MKQTTRKKTLWLAVLCALFVPVVIFSYPGSPPPPSARTGGFGESTCTECHFGTALNAGGGSVSISVPDGYSSDVTYTISVTVSDPTAQRWGFELSSRTQDGRQAGTLSAGSDGFTQLIPSVGGIQYIAHTLAGTRPGTRNSVTFSFNWRAPDTSSGPVVFNAAGNAANNNNTQSGDHIYNTEVTVAPAAASGPAPAVNDLGTVNNASFTPGSTPLAPGTIAAVFGANLNDGSSNAFSSLDDDGKLLTTLGGASVTLNGIAAPIFSSFSSQLNIQIPFELSGSSTASLVVTLSGQNSAAQTVPIGPSSPGIFTIPPGGTGQGAIQIANTTIFAAPTNSISGAQSRPAAAGEIVTIYCTGLGDVTNPPGTGKLASGDPLSTTVATPQVNIGGIPAAVSFSGLAPGFVGLYQINAQVPAGVATGSAVPVVINIDGAQSNTVNLAVGSQ